MNNALSVSTKLNSQVQIFKGLHSVKHYYAQLTDFIVAEQGRYRKSELESQFLKELKDFTEFWQKIMSDFNEAAQNEVVGIIRLNKELREEYFEIVEKVTGFRPPPDKIFLNLLAIRKIAIGLKNSDAVQFLNFDYFKKRNIELNEKWIKDRRDWLLRKVKHFEQALEEHVKIIKNRLNEELWKLHSKRMKHFDRLATKYLRCQSLVSEVNAKESFKLAKLKKFFLLRHDVPAMSYQEFLPDRAQSERPASVSVTRGKLTKGDPLEDEKPASQRTIEKLAKNRKPPKA